MSSPLLQRHTKITVDLALSFYPHYQFGSILFCIKRHAHHAEEKYLLLKQQNVWNSFMATSGTLENG